MGPTLQCLRIVKSIDVETSLPLMIFRIHRSHVRWGTIHPSWWFRSHWFRCQCFSRWFSRGMRVHLCQGVHLQGERGKAFSSNRSLTIDGLKATFKCWWGSCRLNVNEMKWMHLWVLQQSSVPYQEMPMFFRGNESAWLLTSFHKRWGSWIHWNAFVLRNISCDEQNMNYLRNP